MSGEGTYRGEYLYNKDGEGNEVNVPFPGNEKGAFVIPIPLKENILILGAGSHGVSFDTKNNPIDVERFKEGWLSLKISGISGEDSSLTVAIVSYDELADEWIVIDSFETVMHDTPTPYVETRGVCAFGSQLAIVATILGTDPNFVFDGITGLMES